MQLITTQKSMSIHRASELLRAYQVSPILCATTLVKVRPGLNFHLMDGNRFSQSQPGKFPKSIRHYPPGEAQPWRRRIPTSSPGSSSGGYSTFSECILQIWGRVATTLVSLFKYTYTYYNYVDVVSSTSQVAINLSSRGSDCN
jgi:hypothetical protein